MILDQVNLTEVCFVFVCCNAFHSVIVPCSVILGLGQWILHKLVIDYSIAALD